MRLPAPLSDSVAQVGAAKTCGEALRAWGLVMDYVPASPRREDLVGWLTAWNGGDRGAAKGTREAALRLSIWLEGWEAREAE